MNTESIEKIMKISKLKKELIATILPEKVVGHLDVIVKELKLMVLESICDSDSDHDDNNTSKSGVSKIEIE
jgi:hypothetical protein